MIYREQKIKDGYQYNIDDVFGSVEMQSTVQLDGEQLDNITMTLLKQNIKAETVTGEIVHDQGKLKYTYKKVQQWGEGEIIKKCENTHTEINIAEKLYTAILNVPKNISNWCKRFAVAFREAGKNK